MLRAGAGRDDPAGWAAVIDEQVDQVLPPLIVGGGLSFRAAELTTGDVGEPDDPAAGVDDVAEERPVAEHHVPGARRDR